ncbi:MAG: hypothetical protein ACU83N_04375 [Gammaproteobacteria bacterium]
MANLNEKAKQPEESDSKLSVRTPFGYGHEEISDDFSALLSVFGIQGISNKLKQKALRIIRR